MTTRTPRTVAEKMGIKPGWRAHVVGAPPGLLDTLGLPALDLVDLTGPGPVDLDYALLFVKRRAEMVDAFPGLAAVLAPRGKLWVSWPKGGRLGTDLSLPHVIRIGYDLGLVESTCLRIDDTWSGLRFTRPIPGKAYANSFGTLPSWVDGAESTSGVVGQVGRSTPRA